jgi:hypothetical protein
MKKYLFLFAALFLSAFLSTNAFGWEVCETSTDTLDSAGVVTFTSSFCYCLDGDVITIEITPEDPSVVIDSVVFTKSTPHKATNDSWAEQLAVTETTATVALHKMTEKTNTIHLWLYLSTGEHLGVNAHF